jgi:hypothetical protein
MSAKYLPQFSSRFPAGILEEIGPVSAICSYSNYIIMFHECSAYFAGSENDAKSLQKLNRNANFNSIDDMSHHIEMSQATDVTNPDMASRTPRETTGAFTSILKILFSFLAELRRSVQSYEGPTLR